MTKVKIIKGVVNGATKGDVIDIPTKSVQGLFEKGFIDFVREEKKKEAPKKAPKKDDTK